ncbi:hypothetical protein KO500_01155 [Cellulophaga baltica]|uniref:hypothetical protein n=1 Tax=Cellulophaga TaxID=104264 RepID=UPI001C07919E|nr:MULTISPECIES: hypothetical protein [Cellulophaga]MBU2995016.1 hypothetical protein [Cellulophaga baltica]
MLVVIAVVFAFIAVTLSEISETLAVIAVVFAVISADSSKAVRFTITSVVPSLIVKTLEASKVAPVISSS